MNDITQDIKPPLILRFITSIVQAIINIITRIFINILSMALIACALYYGALYVKEHHPEYIDRAKMYIRDNASTYISEVIDFMGINPQQGNTTLSPEQLQQTLTMLQSTSQSTAIPNVPHSLMPVATILHAANKQNIIDHYLTTEKVGSNGHGAIPFLEKMLSSNNILLRNAAHQSLLRIDNPQARSILSTYKPTQ